MFDFRNVVLTPDFLENYCQLFFERHGHLYPFQIGGLETAAIPLVAAIVSYSQRQGQPVTGFYIRKSRKKTGLLNMIEGKLQNQPIILVDDLINSGSTFKHQLTVLKDVPLPQARVAVIAPILQFRDSHYYKEIFAGENIRLDSLFTLNDFSSILPVKNITALPEKTVAKNAWEPVWRWQGKHPHLDVVRPKTGALTTPKLTFTGSDNGVFFALETATGREIWRYQVALGKSRRTFSAPVADNTSVYFGSYDGNIYALDRETGKRRFVYLESDWIEGDLALSHRHHLLYALVQNGFFTKKTEVVAISTKTGQKVWSIVTDSPSQGSLAYHNNSNSLAWGDEAGNVFLVNAKTGAQRWQVKADIKASSAPNFSPDGNMLAVTGLAAATQDEVDPPGAIYILDRKTGNEIARYTDLKFGSYSTPLWYKDTVIITSLDKSIHCFEARSGKRRWIIDTGARLFSSPKLFKAEGGERIYVGGNNAVLYEIIPESGETTSQTFVSERITDAVAYEPESKILFLTTYANEVYALKREPTA